MRTIEAADRNSAKRMNTTELRENFVISDLFVPDQFTVVSAHAAMLLYGQ